MSRDLNSDEEPELDNMMRFMAKLFEDEALELWSWWDERDNCGYISMHWWGNE